MFLSTSSNSIHRNGSSDNHIRMTAATETGDDTKVGREEEAFITVIPIFHGTYFHVLSIDTSH
jgi:hypothetical protein